jgi:hypothetical protein
LFHNHSSRANAVINCEYVLKYPLPLPSLFIYDLEKNKDVDAYISESSELKFLVFVYSYREWQAETFAHFLMKGKMLASARGCMWFFPSRYASLKKIQAPWKDIIFLRNVTCSLDLAGLPQGDHKVVFIDGTV